MSESIHDRENLIPTVDVRRHNRAADTSARAEGVAVAEDFADVGGAGDRPSIRLDTSDRDERPVSSDVGGFLVDGGRGGGVLTEGHGAEATASEGIRGVA